MVTDLQSFCYNTGTCTTSYLLMNTYSNGFDILKVLYDSGRVFWFDLPADSPEDMYLFSMELGMNAGALMRMIFNFYM